MTRTRALLVALAATVALLFQNAMALMAFAWAAVHGAGAAALLAFWPAALGIGVLWTGYLVVTRTSVRHGTLVVTLLATSLLVANEVLLPTPLKAWLGRRAAASVEVLGVKDELLLTAHGNPIGIRLTFEATVPSTGEYLISASSLGRADEDVFWPLDFGVVHWTSVEPTPRPGEGPYDVFESDVVYTFTTEMTPNFLSYDGKRDAVCLKEVRTKYVAEEVFLAALARSRAMKYRGEVHVNGPLVAVSSVAKTFVTSREFDVEAMYRTIAIEGGGRCASGG